MYVYLFLGDIVYVGLSASAMDANVMLSDHSIMVERTFIGLRSQRYRCIALLLFGILGSIYTPTAISSIVCLSSVTIHNRSSVIVRYAWKLCSSKMDEESRKKM